MANKNTPRLVDCVEVAPGQWYALVAPVGGAVGNDCTVYGPRPYFDDAYEMARQNEKFDPSPCGYYPLDGDDFGDNGGKPMTPEMRGFYANGHLGYGSSRV